MNSKTFYILIGLVIGITFILIIGANDKRHCVCNPAGCHWVSGLAKGQTPVDDSYCADEPKVNPTATDAPRLPTVNPTATRETFPTATIDPPSNPTATATKRFYPTATATRKATPTATGEVTDPQGDPASDPAATPCVNCIPCPDIRCSLATVAAAQATQAEFVAGMP